MCPTQAFDTIVIGGGASGIVAAISAKRKGRSVMVLEKMPQPGKKILASGGGRCNLLNDKIDSSFYNPAARNITNSVFRKFNKESILSFFRGLGLEVYSEGGRIFPVTNQSSSVLRVLEIELERLSIPVELSCEVMDISFRGEGFHITTKKGKNAGCRKLILTGGGKTYPALGSEGTCYKFAKHFGHKIIEPVPSAVSIAAKDAMCQLLQGQKISGTAKSVIDGKIKSEAKGDVIFTRYGLSGTAILDVSEEISIALNRHHNKDVFVSIDMVPFMDLNRLRDEIGKRIKKGLPQHELLTGILPNKFGKALKDITYGNAADKIAGVLKDKRFRVIATRGWNEAEFTAGGIDVGEINESTLESKLRSGLYFAGEILDVNGKRGGYNLAW
ncbi:MAG: NAD(P)/FAD-dependent oxidoreductase, partial [Candidatus Omnitrophica bacterium]|nr:NAD(P)/FAD-dependent oxidoreductase [Candidatus Omnitrophota bacterium]